MLSLALGIQLGSLSMSRPGPLNPDDWPGWYIWDLDRFCDCDHCRGKNKHAWSFYYYLKRLGDKPRLKVTKDQIWIAIRKP